MHGFPLVISVLLSCAWVSSFVFTFQDLMFSNTNWSRLFLLFIFSCYPDVDGAVIYEYLFDISFTLGLLSVLWKWYCLILFFSVFLRCWTQSMLKKRIVDAFAIASFLITTLEDAVSNLRNGDFLTCVINKLSPTKQHATATHRNSSVNSLRTIPRHYEPWVRTLSTCILFLWPARKDLLRTKSFWSYVLRLGD